MLSSQDLHALCHQKDVKVIEATTKGPKVLETPAGEIIKLFRPKKGMSSNRYHPYALRFCHNTDRLRELGIAAPKVHTLQHCVDLNIYVARYTKLPGESALARIHQDSEKCLIEAISFISTLHQKGIFFRAIHLSNLLHQPDGSFALLDVADLKFTKNSLSLYKRYRNLKHLFLHKGDRPWWLKLGISHWVNLYSEVSRLPAYQRKILHFLLTR